MSYASPVQDPIAYHLIPAEVWERSDPASPLRVASLDDEGFVHLTHRMADLVEVANTFYRADPRPHVVLTIRLASLTSPWRYDGDERFPHVYGPLDGVAITGVRPIDRNDDGTYRPIEPLDLRRWPDLEVASMPADADGAPGDADRGSALAEERDVLFDEAIDAAIERLPVAFADQLGSVAIVVEEEPTPDQLALVAARGLFGLYQGVPRTRWGVDNVPIPSKITLFRGPLTRVHGGGDRLVAAIADTLYHEIAHHLGIDDDRLRELRLEGDRHG